MEFDGVEFINLTPHEVVIFTENKTYVIPPSGEVLRLDNIKERVGNVLDIPLYKITYGEIPELPPEKPNTYYIVSSMVLLALREKGVHRKDIVAPDTTNPVRDKDGKILGVKGLQVI